MNIKTKLSFCMPVYNEHDSILRYLDEIREGMLQREETYEFSICDDSGVASFQELLTEYASLNKVKIKYSHWEKNTGAATTLYQAVNQATGDTVILLDSDGQFGFDDILNGLEYLKENGYQTIVLYERENKSSTLISKISSKLSSFMSFLLLGKKILLKDLNCALKILPRKDFIKLPLMARHLNYSFEVLFYLSWLEQKKFVHFRCKSRKRFSGTSSMKLFQDGFARIFFLLFLAHVKILIKTKILKI